MEHVLETHKGRSCEYGCAICDGGLALCKVCGGAEGSLTTECCGRELTEVTLDAVYGGTLDFKGGVWVGVASPNSPAANR